MSDQQQLRKSRRTGRNNSGTLTGHHQQPNRQSSPKVTKTRSETSKPTSASSSSNTQTSEETTGNPEHQLPLEEQPYFHGLLPREDVKQLLKDDGDFLVRESGHSQLDVEIVLSLVWDTRFRHLRIIANEDGMFKLEGPKFPSVSGLIWHYWSKQIPLAGKIPALLRRGVKRQRWEFKPKEVSLKNKLGEGHYGEVYRGILSEKYNHREVAVKISKMFENDKTGQESKKFLHEARLLRHFKHPNIVDLVGICVTRESTMIVMEYIVNGAVNTYLHKNKVDVHQKSLFCLDASRGMEFLEARNCLHRDLAARNCLLTDTLNVKIADFGMSRQTTLYHTSRPDQMPFKWTAPEAILYHTFITKSDVWSYGILIYEIFSDGSLPFALMSNFEISEGQKVKPGLRPELPDDTPLNICSIFDQATSYEPQNRPHFHQIRSQLEKSIDMNMIPSNTALVITASATTTTTPHQSKHNRHLRH